MSQPFDRAATCSAPAAPDLELGEFWEDDPWTIAFRHNLSGFERNRTFLNLGNRQFADISYLTGSDSDGDGRSVVAADFRCNGQMDLLVRQAGGGPLLLFENHFPKRSYLKVSLRGSKSNALGIGARLTAVLGDRRLVRELYPANTFHSQEASFVHFGLGDRDTVDSLIIRWPSGTIHELTDLDGNRHIVIDEATGTFETVRPGTPIPDAQGIPTVRGN
ncbi:MAG TPA: ASPIC/UnbV domain-containing protein [Pirellulaceae bacterium]|nr:ASPIC/UnbV domain-containing protein [Pirellulaceae bacterium]